MIRVYVAGPLTQGDRTANVRAAFDAAEELLVRDFAPFVPHWTVPVHGVDFLTYEKWMAFDFVWLAQCQACLRLPGRSAGADREVEWCRAHDVPVFHSIEALLDWRSSRAEEGT